MQSASEVLVGCERAINFRFSPEYLTARTDRCEGREVVWAGQVSPGFLQVVWSAWPLQVIRTNPGESRGPWGCVQYSAIVASSRREASWVDSCAGRLGATQQKKYILTFILLKLQIKDKIWDHGPGLGSQLISQQQGAGGGDVNFVDLKKYSKLGRWVGERHIPTSHEGFINNCEWFHKCARSWNWN